MYNNLYCGYFKGSGEYGEQFKNARRLLTTEAGKLENSVDPEWLEVLVLIHLLDTGRLYVNIGRHQQTNKSYQESSNS